MAGTVLVLVLVLVSLHHAVRKTRDSLVRTDVKRCASLAAVLRKNKRSHLHCCAKERASLIAWRVSHTTSNKFQPWQSTAKQQPDVERL